MVLRLDIERELQQLLREGRKIEAIKLYRDRTGASLLDAKRAVEAMQEGGGRAAGGVVDATMLAELLPSLRMGDRREAVRLYQKRAGVSKREAKWVVAQLIRQHGLYDREAAFLTRALLLAVIAGAALLAAGAALLALR